MKSKKNRFAGKTQEIAIEKITSISKFNPRKNIDDSKINELAKSIKENSLLHRITVVLKKNGEYELISGQRRLNAFKRLGRETIPAKVLEKTTEDELLSIIIIENIQRVDIKPIEMANAIEELYKKLNGDISKVAEKIGKSKSTVRLYRNMLRLNDNIKENISTKKLILPIKTSSAIGKNFPQDKQQIVIDVIESHPQETQLKIIKVLKDDFNKISAYDKSDLIIKFVKKVLLHDLRTIQHAINHFLENLRKMNDNISEMLRRTPILRLFNEFGLRKEFDLFRYKMERVISRHDLDLIESSYNLKHYPLDSLTNVLEHLRLNLENYDQKFKEEISNDLFNFIIVDIISEPILRTLKCMNQSSMKYRKEVLPLILNQITNNQLNSRFALTLFTFFELLYFKDNLSIVKDVSKTENENIALKRLIINKLGKKNKHSSEIQRLQNIIFDLYMNTEDSGLRSNAEIVLLKIGKICSTCKSIINLDKKINEIPFCNNCNQTYCNECIKKGNYILKCSCGTEICINCQDKFEIIEKRSNKNSLFCDFCWEEGKYQKKNILCNQCISLMKHCDNCGKKICSVHQESMYSNRYYCGNCSDAESDREYEEEDDEDDEGYDEKNDEFDNYILEDNINDYITLKLSNEGYTEIFIDGEHFDQCIRLVFQIPVDFIENFDEINSIDEAELVYKSSMDEIVDELDVLSENHQEQNCEIIPEEEFRAHVSNLQAWVEHDYDTRLLHRSLAFPLLKSLTELGDPLAKKVFKDEIATRLESSSLNVLIYLVNEGYLDYLNKEEIEVLFKNTNSNIYKNLLEALKNKKIMIKYVSPHILEKIFEYKFNEEFEQKKLKE